MKVRLLTESGCGLTKKEANDLGFNGWWIKFVFRERLYASN